ncbi:MAG: DUF6438 domain-containing protein, partial [Bacteroidota bacterium]
SFLLFGCGRDAAEVGAPAAAPALAPVPAPAKKVDVSNLQKIEPSGVLEEGHKVQAVELESVNVEKVPDITREDAKNLSPVNRGRKRRTTTADNNATNSSPAVQTEPNLGEEPQMVIDVKAIAAKELFRVAKTPCYGDCKQYAVTIYDDGLVVMHGKKNVIRKGYYTQRIANLEQSELWQYFREATAEGLLRVYPAGEAAPADVPATVLTYLGVDGQPQAIRVYADAPEKLQRLFDLIEEMAESGAWQIAKG